MADNMINSKPRKINDKQHNAPGNRVFEVNSHFVYKEDAYFHFEKTIEQENLINVMFPNNKTLYDAKVFFYWIQLFHLIKKKHIYFEF